MQARAGGVLERVADRVADDRGGVRRRALPEDVPGVILEPTRLDVLLRVVPRAAAVVEDSGEDDARHRADHQQRGLGLGLEENADHDGSGDRKKPWRDHVAKRGRGRDVDDARVVGLLGAGHDPGVLAELRPHLLDDRGTRPTDRADRER